MQGVRYCIQANVLTPRKQNTANLTTLCPVSRHSAEL
jgi:hypothetical protein